jgi:hypothetical protein
MKTSELTGAALDWAVAKCEGITWEQGDLDAGEYGPGFKPSTDWAHGGPIIERGKIDTFNQDNGYNGAILMATRKNPHPTPYFGETTLIAAMRCYVASKVGDDIEIPKEVTA